VIFLGRWSASLLTLLLLRTSMISWEYVRMALTSGDRVDSLAAGLGQGHYSAASTTKDRLLVSIQHCGSLRWLGRQR
jgi:hypothetical protein